MSSSTHAPEWQKLNRTYIAQVSGVKPEKGIVDLVVLDNLLRAEGGTHDPISIAVGGFSVHGFNSSWQRYMPRKGDRVLVSYSAQNVPYIVGNALEPGAYEAAVKVLRNIGLEELRDLKGGEWDMRSAGGAYLLGNVAGELLMSAGQVLLRLDKRNNDARGMSGLWKFESGPGSFIRLGDVKRNLLPGDFTETDLSSVTSLAPLLTNPVRGTVAGAASPFIALDRASKEYWVHIENPNPSPVKEIIADEQLGAVRNGGGLPIMSSSNPVAVLRHNRKIYALGSTNFAPINAFSSETDSFGNVRISNGPLATEMKVSGGLLTSIDVSCLKGSVGVSLPLLLGGGLKLGSSSATEQAVHGTSLMAELTLLTTQLNLFMTAFQTMLPVLAQKVGMFPTPLPGAELVVATQTAATALQAQLTTFMGKAVPPSPLLLSQKVAID